MGLENPISRTRVAIDTQKDNKVVAFSRWLTPQADGNLETKWPEFKEDDWDMNLVEKFFGGMEENRHLLMGSRPHWCKEIDHAASRNLLTQKRIVLEMLGTREDYQKQGIGAELISWGTKQADEAGVETYLDGTEVGQPYYKKHHNFKYGKDIEIPDR